MNMRRNEKKQTKCSVCGQVQKSSIRDFYYRDFVHKPGPMISIVFRNVEVRKCRCGTSLVIWAMGKFIRKLQAHKITCYAEFVKGRWEIT